MSVRLTAACAALLACTACSSSTEPAAPALTGAPALRAAGVFAALGATSDVAVPGSGGSVTSCPKGGTVRSTITSATATTTRARITFASCAGADSTGQVWTFTSLPALDVSFTTAQTDSTISMDGTTSGTLRVESASTRGSCAIATRQQVTFRVAPPFSIRARQSGLVCGQAIDTTYSETL